MLRLAIAIANLRAPMDRMKLSPEKMWLNKLER
jgi:hypothetical protein